MPNYQESEIDGVKWRRCERIEIYNPSSPETPQILFHERDVISVDGIVMKMNNEFPSSLNVKYNPSATINIYDPETLQPTGETISHAELYLMLFSAYMNSAIARDEMIASITPPAQ